MNDTAFGTLQDLVGGLDKFGDAPAVVAFAPDGMSTVDYRTLRQRSLALAGGLIARGFASGTPVALFAPNSAEWIVCRLALIVADALCVPIDFDADADRVALLLRDSGARTVFTTAALLDVVNTAGTKLDGPPEIVLLAAGDGKDLPTIETIAGEAPTAPPVARPDAPVAQFYTSGTTGTPKAVPLTHRNILTNTRILLALGVLRSSDRVALPLPLHHSYPFIVGLVLPLLAGATVVLPAGVSGPHLVRALKDGDATLLVGVPRLFEAMATAIDSRLRSQGGLAGRTLLALSGHLRRRLGLRVGRTLLAPLHRQIAPRLKTVVCGGAKLDATTEWRLEALGWRVLTGYGLVETTSVATFNRPDAARVGSAGKPSPAVEIRLAPIEGLENAEIQFRGPIVFSGYRDNPTANAEAFTEDGWFRTGDLGRLDGDGFLFIVGRSKEMIVLPDGKNVAPEEVEAVYGRSPYVRELAVLERNGRLVAIVVPDLEAARAAATGRIGDELRMSFGELGVRLPRYMRIADFVTMGEALPRNQLGKYLRHRLPDLYDSARRGERRAARAPSDEDRARMEAPRAVVALSWLAERFPGRTIDPDTSLHMDLEIDSLAWIDLSLDLERRLGIALSEETIARLVTVRDLLDAVEHAPTAANGAARAPAALPQRDWLAAPSRAAETVGWLLYAIAWLGTRGLLRLSAEGQEHLALDGPMIIAVNHESDLDPVVLAAALPRSILRRLWWGADARRVFGSRAGRALAAVAHLFPVDDLAPAASIDRAVAVLERGRALAWFPEEWRSPDGELLPFRPGIGAMVARSGATVVPAHIEGTFEAMPRTARLPRPHKVRVRFGAPLSAAQLQPGPAPADERQLHRTIAARVQEAVAALVDRPIDQIR